MAAVTALALLVALQGASAQPPIGLSATEVANSTKFELTFSGPRIVGCSVTATSGFAQVDRYVCDAARNCGDKYSNADRRAACIAEKREQLGRLLAKD